MKFKIFIYSLLSFVFAQNEAIQLQDESEEISALDHISMLIHEDLINVFCKKKRVYCSDIK